MKARGEHAVRRESVNFVWWQFLLSEALVGCLLRDRDAVSRWRFRLECARQRIDIRGSARRAARALVDFRREQTFRQYEVYRKSVAAVADFVGIINAMQDEIAVSLGAGPHVPGLAYDRSSSLGAFAGSESFLKRTISEALDRMAIDADLVLVSVTSPQDLLSAMIMADILKRAGRARHVSLIDHGYENFSLHACVEALVESGIVGAFFDSVVVSKDERDRCVSALVETLVKGETPARRLASRDEIEPAGKTTAFPVVPIFAPEPIFWTRLSARRCYWSRCSYCTQNEKYESEKVPVKSDVAASLRRLQGFENCRLVLFSDEALSPAILGEMAAEVARQDIRITWACRCKLERAHTRALLRSIRDAGCFEILFGIETTSQRVQAIMDKRAAGVEDRHIARVLDDMSDLGIGAHINLIGGFPGETIEEARASVDFFADRLPDVPGASVLLNAFVLMQGTPMARAPRRFGLENVRAPGDLAQTLAFDLAPEVETATREVVGSLDVLRGRLLEALGWNRSDPDGADALARELYVGSGHGALMKLSGASPRARDPRPVPA